MKTFIRNENNSTKLFRRGIIFKTYIQNVHSCVIKEDWAFKFNQIMCLAKLLWE